MSIQAEISQRDLRLRSKEIMDAVEHGESFTVTRDGRAIGALAPLPRRPRFLGRAEFAAHSHSAPVVDLAQFRADQDDSIDQSLDDPYAR